MGGVISRFGSGCGGRWTLVWRCVRGAASRSCVPTAHTLNEAVFTLDSRRPHRNTVRLATTAALRGRRTWACAGSGTLLGRSCASCCRDARPFTSTRSRGPRTRIEGSGLRLVPKRRENRGRRNDHRHRYHHRVRHRGVPPVAHLELARPVTASPACSRRRQERVPGAAPPSSCGSAAGQSGIETARQKDAAGHPWWPRRHDHPLQPTLVRGWAPSDP